MATLAEFRAQYPEYDSIPDVALADSLHQKFYSKMPKMEFYKTIGLGAAHPESWQHRNPDKPQFAVCTGRQFIVSDFRRPRMKNPVFKRV